MVYKINIAGLERDLKLCPLNDQLSIAAFVMFGDVELTEHCAAELLKRAPAFDVMITAESKGIPLVYEMSRLAGQNRYVLARKSVKVYMTDIVSYNVTSITTKNRQTLYLDGEDAAYLKDKRVLIVDDVVSTGESLIALENLVSKAGGKIAGRLTVLAEGDAQYREDLIYLERLPLFHADGSILE